jgi:hypothetical protein
MTNYVGELMRVTMAATDFAGDELDDTEVDEARISIWDAAAILIVDNREMAYSTDEALFFFLWITTEDGTDAGTPLAVGSYRAKCTLVDLDGHRSWEFIRIRLARNPVGD